MVKSAPQEMRYMRKRCFIIKEPPQEHLQWRKLEYEESRGVHRIQKVTSSTMIRNRERKARLILSCLLMVFYKINPS